MTGCGLQTPVAQANRLVDTAGRRAIVHSVEGRVSDSQEQSLSLSHCQDCDAQEVLTLTRRQVLSLVVAFVLFVASVIAQRKRR